MSTANLSSAWTHLSDIVVESGEGAILSDAGRRRYLDFTSGIGVTNTGHCHPRAVAAAQAQVAKLMHGQINVVLHRPRLSSPVSGRVCRTRPLATRR